MTKQSEAREQVRDLIEQLSVGQAIPSERQLCIDLGVSRLTVRAALDELVREGHLVRRRGAGTFVSEPKIAQELTMSSFTDDIRARGHDTGEPHARAGRGPRRGAARPRPPRLAVRARRRRDAPPPRRPRDDGDRDAARARVTHPRAEQERPRERLLLRAAPRPLRHHDRRRPADDRAHGDERGRVGGARACRCTRPPSCSSASRDPRAARSSSSSARSTAETATVWSPSSACVRRPVAAASR